MLCWAMRSPTVDTYMLNNIGPRTEPWGTPDRHATVSDRSVPTAMNWLRSVTNDFSQSRLAPLMPKTVLARSTSVVWSTASNAADMSSASNTAVHWPSPAARRILFTTLTRTVLVEQPFLLCGLKFTIVTRVHNVRLESGQKQLFKYFGKSVDCGDLR